jgi:hypothetical protein
MSHTLGEYQHVSPVSTLADDLLARLLDDLAKQVLSFKLDELPATHVKRACVYRP